MGVIGNLNAYTQYQTAQSIPDAAKNPGGLGAIGAGLGMGMGIANQVGQSMSGQLNATPPPVPTPPTFFIAVNGQQSGPHDPGVLQAMAAKGEVTRETLVWRQGMPNWTPAASVPELAALFNNVPPPLPK